MELKAPLVERGALDPTARPLVVAPRPLPTDAAWSTLTAAVTQHGAGLVFVLEHPADSGPAAADVIGVLTDGGTRRNRSPNTAHALSESQHPAVRYADRRLR